MELITYTMKQNIKTKNKSNYQIKKINFLSFNTNDSKKT